MSAPCGAQSPTGKTCVLEAGHLGMLHYAEKTVWKAREPRQAAPCVADVPGAGSGFCVLDKGHDGPHRALGLSEAMLPLALAFGIVAVENYRASGDKEAIGNLCRDRGVMLLFD